MEYLRRFSEWFAENQSLVFALIGGAVALYALRVLWRAWGTDAWPPVMAEVVHSEVEESWSGTTQMYRADVKYRYVVDGKEFVSDQVFAGGNLSASWRSFAEDRVNAYYKGKQVAAYVNPEDPTQAVLEKGPNPLHYLTFVVAILFIIVSAFI